jgi:hypothetical protein
MDPIGSEAERKERGLATGQLLAAYTVGTALLAVWSYVRWPGAAPASLGRAILRMLAALLLLQLGLVALHAGVAASPGTAAAIALLVGTVVPVLTFAFLASLWFLKACADQLRGA